MGTRNLTMVQKNGEIKVAQYGQWDGYPSGQGATILEFCRNAQNLKRLEEKLPQVRFLTDDECNDLNEKIKLNDTETLRVLYKFWHRDIGGEILSNIIDAQGDVRLRNDYSFGYNGLFCEWAYCINFDTRKLEVYTGFTQQRLNEKERFYSKEPKDGYYGVRLIKEYDLDNLPTVEEFVDELEGEWQ